MNSLYMSVDITDRQTIDSLKYCQILAKQKIKGNFVDDNSFHITVDFLGDNETDINLVKEAMNLFKERYGEEYHSFYVFANTLNRFDMGAAWIDVNNSFKLYQIHYLLQQLYQEVGYQKKKDKFEGYTPHITFAYDTEEFIPFKLPRTPILVDNISLWNSPKMNGEYITSAAHIIKL